MRSRFDTLAPDYEWFAVVRYCCSGSLGGSGRGSTFNVVASVIFAVVALLHLLRIYMGWPIVIGSWTAPIWVSWIAPVVAGGLSYFGLTLARQAPYQNLR